MADTQSPENHLFQVDFLKYIDILIKQKAFVLVFTLSAVLSSVALTYIFSEKYEAGTTVFYQADQSSLLREKNVEAFGSPAPSPPFKIISQTLSDVVKSEVILRPIVKELHLDEKEEIYESIWYKRWYRESKEYIKDLLSKFWSILKYGRVIEADPTEKAIRGLRENISIRATKDSYIYVLTVKDKYPDRAARIVDRAGQLLVEWLKEQEKNPAEEKRLLLQKKLAEKEEEMRGLQEAREALLKQYDIVSLSEEKDEGVRNLYDLQKESVRVGADIAEKRAKISELDSKISRKAYLQPEDYKKMTSEKLFEQIELNGLIAKMESIQSSITQLETKLGVMPSLQKKLDELDMKINAGIREYENLKDLYVEVFTQVETGGNNTRVLHPATVPVKPVQPIKIYHVGLTACLALMLSMGLVYVFAFFNIRIFFSSQGIKGRQQHDATENQTENRAHG